MCCQSTIFAYYLAHREELDAYLEQRDQEAQCLRQEWEVRYPAKITRAELERRLAARNVAPIKPLDYQPADAG